MANLKGFFPFLYMLSVFPEEQQLGSYFLGEIIYKWRNQEYIMFYKITTAWRGMECVYMCIHCFHFVKTCNIKSSYSQTKAAANTPPTVRRDGSWRVHRHKNPKPSLWIGQKSSLPSSSRSSSKNWLLLHKSTPSYHTFLWKSDRVPVGFCDESK